MFGWPWCSTWLSKLPWLGWHMSPTEKTTVSMLTMLPSTISLVRWLVMTRFFHPLTAIHEKIFIVFMVSSQAHMLIVLKLLKMAQFGAQHQRPVERRSYFFKRLLFLLSLLFTFGLCIFFVKHRVYCHDMGTCVLISARHFVFGKLSIRVAIRTDADR